MPLLKNKPKSSTLSKMIITIVIINTNKIDDIMHPRICGTLYDYMFKIVSVSPNGKELVGEIDFKMGPSEKHRVHGQFNLVEISSYDLAAYSLLAEMFGLNMPYVYVVKYNDRNYFMYKKNPTRLLRESDYYPKSAKNYSIRLQLAMIVYFCKLIGYDFNLHAVEIFDGTLIYMQPWSLGSKKPVTITQELFAYLFEVMPLSCSRQYVEYVSNSVEFTSDSDLLRTEMNGYGNTLFKSTVGYAVVEHFRSIDFDTDILRQYVYLRDEPVRSSMRNRTKYKLGRASTIVCSTIEYNHSVLISHFPFSLWVY